MLVYGCGTLGLLTIAILRLLHPKSRVLAVARFPHQHALAERFGAATRCCRTSRPRPSSPASARRPAAQVLTPWFGMPWVYGGGVDVVYDTVGFPETIEVGMRVAASRGAIVITGVEMPRRFEWTPLYFKEIAVIGSNAFGVEEFEGARRHSMEILPRPRPAAAHRRHADPHPPLSARALAGCASSPAAIRPARAAVKVLFTYPHDGAEAAGG